jgi:RimJ/RimL family protein N-acetyltransferase
MLPQVDLVPISREDMIDVDGWLRDEEVCASWFGRGEDGQPLHVGYSPAGVIGASQEELDKLFGDEQHHILSIYTAQEGHIGEAQMHLDLPLRQAQVMVLVGRKDLWFHGYGTAAMVCLLDLVFNYYDLHRAWVDVPQYNFPAHRMCENVGFILEGRLRNNRLKDGDWYDSLVMGLLSDEFARRKSSVQLDSVTT